MPRFLTRSTVAMLVTLLAAAPAFAHTPPPPGGGCRVIRGAQTTDPADDVSVCRQDVYFHKGSVPLGNLAHQDPTAIPSWNTTRPTGPLHEAGVYAASAEYDIFAEEGGKLGRPSFTGKFTGPIDTLGFRMYMAELQSAAFGVYEATVHLEIDGEVLHDNYTGERIFMPVVEEEGLYRLDGAFTNVYEAMKAMSLDLSPTREHTVTFEIVSWSFPSDGVFLYDADAVASGMFFNLEPSSMAGFTKVDVQPA